MGSEALTDADNTFATAAHTAVLGHNSSHQKISSE